MGITHHTHGVENVQAIANLALVRGMVGKPGAGLLPIRGHSNVQGMGTVGVTPKLREAIFARLESQFNLQLPTEPGLDTMSCIEAAGAGKLQFGFCLGGNLYGSNPDAAFAVAALGKLDLLVYLSTALNTGHAQGLAQETLILPVLARDEEPLPTTQESMFSYVRLSDGGPRRHDGPRSEIQIIASLGQRVLGGRGPVDWQSMEQTGRIREVIAKIIPGLEPIGEIDRTRQEFFIPGRNFREPRFATTDGRARLFVHELPELAGEMSSSQMATAKLGSAGVQLRLMTVRSEGQFNTVVYEDYDLYRGVDRRDVVLVHPDDIARCGLEPHQRVRVKSMAGAMENIILWPFPDTRSGNALMYYPEANVLVPRSVDPQSKTPAFKNVLITLEPFSPIVNDRKAQHEIVVTAASNSRGTMRAC
jgi:molybdopterin-dependent oxidoreductase alpha subunit